MDGEHVHVPASRFSIRGRELPTVRVLLWLALLLGVLFTAANIQLPVARNGLPYASGALAIVQSDFDILKVARDSAATAGKPVLFSIIAAPFTWAFDAGAGVVIASAIGTGFFVWMSVLALRRILPHSANRENETSLALVLIVANPLVIYQFWSAYPDSLFAGLVLLAFVLTDIIATSPERDTRWHTVGLGSVIAVAIHTKLYGVILGLTCPLYMLWHARTLARSRKWLGWKLVPFLLVFAVLALLLTGTKVGLNPFLQLNANAGWSDSQFAGIRQVPQAFMMSAAMLGFAALLNFHFAVAGLISREARRALSLPQGMFVAAYVLGLFTFVSTPVNMRYFLPAFPFFAAILAKGIQSLAVVTRRGLLTAYGLAAVALTLPFNLEPVERAAHPLIARIYRWEPGGWLDNLRLPIQVELRKQIAAVNAQVPAGSILYWSSNYYGTITHALPRHLGIKRGLDIRPVLYNSAVPSHAGPVFLTEFTSFRPNDELPDAPTWSSVTPLGNGVFRLDPFFLECAQLRCDSAPLGQSVRLRLRATTARLRANSIEIAERHSRLAAVRSVPMEFEWQSRRAGRHEIVARASTLDGLELVSPPFVIYAGVSAVERTITSITDVALEQPSGAVTPIYAMYRYFSYYPYGRPRVPRGAILGVRFTDIPSGRRIAKASVEIPSLDDLTSELQIRAQPAADTRAFSWTRNNLSQRTRTTTRVTWRPHVARTEGAPRSPDISSVLNEALASSSSSPLNDVVLLIELVGGDAPADIADDARGRPRLIVELAPMTAQAR